MPKISIIVPCFNQAEYLSDTLDSVILQTYTDWECVVVDDGSTDGSATIANSYCAKDNRIKYLFQTNKGPSSARNNGILNTSGDFILPLDADDLIAPTYLEVAMKYFRQHPQCKLVYPKVELFGTARGIMNVPEYSYEAEIWENIIVCSGIFRRSDYLLTRGYDEQLSGYEDWDFWLSLLKPEDEVYRTENVMFYYRKKVSSRNISAGTWGRELCRKIYLNHKDIYSNYTQDIITLYHAEKRLNHLLGSKAFRVGNLVMAPFYWLKKLMILLTKK